MRNWLSGEECSAVLARLQHPPAREARLRMLAMLFGFGLWRSELVGLEMNDIQVRQVIGLSADGCF